MADHPIQHPLEQWISQLVPGTPAAQLIHQSISENPDRIDRAYAELLKGYLVDPAKIFSTGAQTTPEQAGENHLVVRNLDIPFLSLCVHHFLPFFGTIDVAYVPGPRLPGLGKISRLVACHAQRLQVQELLVRDIAEDLIEFADVNSVQVKAVTTHTCICYRGPMSAGTRNSTTYDSGDIRADSNDVSH